MLDSIKSKLNLVAGGGDLRIKNISDKEDPSENDYSVNVLNPEEDKNGITLVPYQEYSNFTKKPYHIIYDEINNEVINIT